MDRIIYTDHPVEEHASNALITWGSGWGFIGGLFGTLIMDILLMGFMPIFSLPALLCFTIVGETASQFFSMLGVQLAGGVSIGITTHYIIGPLVGASFGAILIRGHGILRANTLKKCIVLAILYVEILSLPILALAPVLLKMTSDRTLLWYGGAFPAHMICGIVLGIIVYHGLKKAGGTR